jgi:multicomponent Na+:H+ antiporter subunit E
MMRLRQIPLLVIWLTVLWVLLWGDVSAANVITGIFFGSLILAGARLTRDRAIDAETLPRINPLMLGYFVGYVIMKLVQANLVLAWEILTPRNRISSGIIAVPLHTDSKLAMLTVASVITLTPGSVLLEAKETPTILYAHVLHLHDPENIRRGILRIEELTIRAYGSRHDRAQLKDRTQQRSGLHSSGDLS